MCYVCIIYNLYYTIICKYTKAGETNLWAMVYGSFPSLINPIRYNTVIQIKFSQVKRNFSLSIIFSLQEY